MSQICLVIINRNSYQARQPHLSHFQHLEILAVSMIITALTRNPAVCIWCTHVLTVLPRALSSFWHAARISPGSNSSTLGRILLLGRKIKNNKMPLLNDLLCAKSQMKMHKEFCLKNLASTTCNIDGTEPNWGAKVI